MKLNYYRFPEGTSTEILEQYDCDESDDVIGGVSVTFAKQMLKQYGGAAWTCHIDRDGGCFETSEIKLKSNNSKFKYNRHL